MATPSLRRNRVLGIDPASIRTGYALCLSPDILHEAGYLTVNRRDPAVVRITELCEQFDALLRDLRPDLVCMEIPSGHVGSLRHKGGGAGLATYGMAVGALWFCMRQLSTELHFVAWHIDESWTGGRKKAARRREVARIVPSYKANIAKDPGGDIADAIELCWWAYREQRRRAALEDA